MITVTLTDAEARRLLHAYDQATYHGLRASLGEDGVEALRALCTRLDAQLRRAAAEAPPIVTMRSLDYAPAYPYACPQGETVCGPADRRGEDCRTQLQWPRDGQGSVCADCVSERLGGF